MSNYTAWRATYQSSEQAARAAFQQLERAASPITEDMARAEFRRWLSQNRASLGRLGDTMAALMEQAAIEVATRFQFVTATLEQTEPQPVATINKNNCLSIDDANRLMRLGPGTKLYVQPPSGEVPEGSREAALGAKRFADDPKMVLAQPLTAAAHIRGLADLILSTPTTPQADGWVLMPEELTAENGAKSLLMSEFHEVVELECGVCDADDEHCDGCGGNGSYTYRVPVSWPTIKSIYRLAVAKLQRPQPPAGQEGA